MNDIDPFSEAVGDYVPDGASIPVYEDEFKSVLWVRRGDYIDVVTFTKVDAIIAANRAAANDFSKSSKLGNMVRVANVPIDLHYQLVRDRHINEDNNEFARFLNNPDNAAFRVNGLVI
jgi:hypothetical protein